MLDNYDSFTWNLVDYLEQLNTRVQVVRNDEVSVLELQRHPWDGIVISPGPRKPEESGILMEVIEHFHEKIPMLGICLGHQALGSYFGWKLYQMTEPVHGKTSTLVHENHPMFQSCPEEFEVCRYHSLALKEIKNQSLLSTSWACDDKNGRVCMSLCHKQLPLWGIQYHPEAILTENGLQVLKNWINFNDLNKAET
jgi:anthranilate synthase/aminodeoxychorismate synthase-like glutamine amidotransferase